MSDGQPDGSDSAEAPQGPAGQPAGCQAVRQEDLSCPICFETLADPFVTSCGHTFCYSCVSQHLQHAKNCPSCSHFLSTDLIHPNFLLSKIVKRAKSPALGSVPSALEVLQHAIAEHRGALAECDVDALLHQLWEQKQGLQAQQQESSMELLMHFLQSSREDKVARLAQLHKELMCLDGDIQRVEAAGATTAAPSSSQQQGAAAPAALAAGGPAAAAGEALPPTAGARQQQQPQQQKQQQHVALPQQQQQQPQQALPALLEAAAGAPAATAAAGAYGHMAAPGAPGHLGPSAATAAVGQAARQQQQQLFQQHAQMQGQPPHMQMQMQAGGQLPPQQRVADFAGAAYASLAAQAMSAGGGSGSGILPMLPAAMAGAAYQHMQQQQQPPGGFSGMYGSQLGPSTTSSGGGGGNGAGPSSGRPGSGQRNVLSLLRNKKRRIASQFDDLQQCYMHLRANQLEQAAALAAAGATAAAVAAAAGEGGGGAGGRTQVATPGALAAAAPGAVAAAGVGPVIDEGLQEFSRLLSVITRCNKLKLIAEIPRPSLRQSSSIISSLEFDKDGSLFATAGVSKRISVFEFASVAPSTPSPGVHCPVVELVSRSKLSCLSWNKYIQAHIASSDYEGVVSVWDVSTGALLHEFEAHSKRIWSVDFCEADPTLLASGSDDCTVKFWSTKAPSSVAQIDTKANVCAVRWRPGSSHELAVGSADHSVYLYDMRNTAMPVRTFQGHRKAVSYVRFCNSGDLVSASTDSTLRLWGLDALSSEAQRVYEGHANEKNFVGLAVDGDFLACGSESSELYVYYKSLSKPVAQQAFTVPGEEGGAMEPHSDKSFISAVCWRPRAHTLLAANSMGTVKVFSLTGSGQV